MRDSRKTEHQNSPSGQRDWYEKPAGKVVIGLITGLITGLLLWFITDRVFSQRNNPPPVVVEIPVKAEPTPGPQPSPAESPKRQRTGEPKTKEEPKPREEPKPDR